MIGKLKGFSVVKMALTLAIIAAVTTATSIVYIQVKKSGYNERVAEEYATYSQALEAQQEAFNRKLEEAKVISQEHRDKAIKLEEELSEIEPVVITETVNKVIEASECKSVSSSFVGMLNDSIRSHFEQRFSE